jgi:hypothetical protein
MPNVICVRDGLVWKRCHDLEAQAKEVRKDEPNEITPEGVAAFLSEGGPVHFDAIFNLAKKAGYKAGDEKAFKANLDLGVQQGQFYRVVIRDGSKQPKEGYTKTRPTEHINQEVYNLIPHDGVTLEDLKAHMWTVGKFYAKEVEAAVSNLKGELAIKEVSGTGRAWQSKRLFRCDDVAVSCLGESEQSEVE